MKNQSFFFILIIGVFIISILIMIFNTIFLSSYRAEQKKGNQANISHETVGLAKQLLAVPDHQIINIKIGERQLAVEIVNTPASITQGLSGRETIGSDGMLFIFPEKKIATFWMKEMKFNLDLIWISENKIIEITKNASYPAPAIPLSELEIYRPQAAVEMVLEVKVGNSQQFKIGDQIQLSF